MNPYRDYPKTSQFGRTLPIAIKSSADNTFTSVSINEAESTDNNLQKPSSTNNLYHCRVEKIPKKANILRDEVIAICRNKIYSIIFHFSNLLHYILIPYVLIYWFSVVWVFYTMFYLAVVNDIIYIIYTTIRCRKLRKLGEWLFNVLLVFPFWLTYQEISDRMDWQWQIQDFDVGFFIFRCATSPIRLYWTIHPLKIFQYGDTCRLKLIGKIALLIFLMIHGGAILWSLAAILSETNFWQIKNGTRQFHNDYGTAIIFVADIITENAQPGPFAKAMETNLFIVFMSLISFLFFAYMNAIFFIERDLHNKRSIKLQLFTNTLKLSLRKRGEFELLKKVEKNYQNVELYKKSVADDECQLLLQQLNWPLVQDILYARLFPLRYGVILGAKHLKSECFLQHLSTKIRRDFYNQGEHIYQLGYNVDKMVILTAGYLHVMSEDRVSPLITLEPGTCLGQIGLLMTMHTKASVICATHVRVLTLTKKDFLLLAITQFPDVYRQIFKSYLTQIMDSRKKKHIMMIHPPQYDVKITEKVNLNLYKLYCNNNLNAKHSYFVAHEEQSKVGKVDDDLTLNAIWNMMMIVVSIIVAVTYPYFVAFRRHFPPGFNMVAIPLEILLIIDLILTLIAFEMPKSKQTVPSWKRKYCKKHLWYKLNDWSFYLDFASAICIENITFVLYGTSLHPTQLDFLYYFLKLNRVLKIYKLYYFVWSLHFSSQFYKRLIIHMISIVIVSYYGAVLLYLFACFDPTCSPTGWFRTLQNYEYYLNISDPRTNHSFYCSLYASLVCIHHMDPHISADKDLSINIFIIFLGYIYFTFMFIDLANIRYIQLKNKLIFSRDMFEIRRFSKMLSPTMAQRMLEYYRLQWLNDPSYPYHYRHGNYITKSLNMDILLTERFESISKIPILNAIGKKFCKFLVLRSKIYVLPPNEVVTYAGNMNKEILILVQGYCCDGNGDITNPVNPMRNGPSKLNVAATTTTAAGPEIDSGEIENLGFFGMPSTLFNLPEAQTIMTITPCVFISVDGSALQEALLHYPLFAKRLSLILRSQAYVESTQLIQQNSLPQFSVPDASERRNNTRCTKIKKLLAQRSVVNVLKYCKQNNEAYGDPFRKEEIEFMRFCMLPFTIDSWGVLFFLWVCLRASVALYFGLATPLMLFGFGYTMHTSPVMFIFNIFCDIVLLLDIILLSYLIYAKQNGIIVVHPYATFRHYGGRGMFIDVVLALPIEWIYRTNYDDYRMFSYLRLFKIVQVYKFFIILGKVKPFEVCILKRTVQIIKCIALIAIITNACTCAMIAKECQPLNGYNISIPKDSWMRRTYLWEHHIISWTETEDVLTINQIYLLALHWSTGLLFSCNYFEFTTTGENIIVVIIIIIMGIFIQCFIIKTTIPYFVGTLEQFKNTSRSFKFYKMLQTLMLFLNREEGIDKQMKIKLRENAAHYWRVTNGIDNNVVLSKLHTTLLQDTLCSLYQKTLMQVPLFKNMDNAFLRILVLIAKPLHFLPNQIIINQEDVCDQFYIILDGIVHVELSRSSYKVLITTGSIFGYFSKETTPLMSITATTSNYVHVLSFKSIDYFNILKNYDKFYVELKGVLSEYKDFMPNRSTDEIGLLPDVHSDYRITFRPGTFFKKIYTYKVFDKIFSIFAFLNAMLVPLSFFVAPWTIIYYYITMDVIFIIAFSMEFFKPYYDNQGRLIVDCKAIRKNNLKKTVQLLRTFELFCIVVCVGWYGIFLQIMIFSLEMPAQIFGYFRLASMYRCRYIGHRSFKDVNDNLFMLQFMNMLFYMLVLLHWSSCIWIVIGIYMNTLQTIDYYLTLCLVGNLFAQGGIAHGVIQQEWEVMVVAIYLPMFALFKIYFIAKAIAIIYMQVKLITRFNFQLKQLKAYLRTLNIKQYQRRKISKHLEQLQNYEMGKNFPEILNYLPSPLTAELKVLLYRPMLEKSFVFYGTQMHFLQNVAMRLRRSIYFEEEIIVNKGEFNKNMYFIREGSVEITSVREDRSLRRHDILQAGEMFGLVQGLLHQNVPHQFTFRALSRVEILSLRLDHWEHLLRYFPKSKETIYSRVRNVRT